MPVPVREILSDGLDASLEMEVEELTVPAALGVKVMLIGALWPAAIVSGRPGLASEKDPLAKLTALMVSDADPEFVAVVEMLLLLPTAMLPKLRDELFTESVPL